MCACVCLCMRVRACMYACVRACMCIVARCWLLVVCLCRYATLKDGCPMKTDLTGRIMVFPCRAHKCVEYVHCDWQQ